MNNPFIGLPRDQIRAMIAEEEAKLANPYLGRPREEIRAMIAEEEAKQQGASSDSGRHAKRLGRSAATGLVSYTADLPNLASLGLHAAGLKEDPYFYEPMAERLREYIDKRTEGELLPQNKFEEWEDTIVEGAAPFLLAPFTGGASLTATGLKALGKATGKEGIKKIASKASQFNPYKPTATTLGGNIGSSIGAKAYTEIDDKPNILGTLAASMAGGIGGAKISRFAKNPKETFARTLAEKTKFNPLRYNEAKELDLPISVANVSDTKWAPKVEHGMSYVPGSKSVLEKFHEGQRNSLVNNMGLQSYEKANNLIKTPADYLAKKGAQGYEDLINTAAEKHKNVFRPREEQAIKNKEQVDISDIENKIAHERRGLETEGELDLFSKTPYGELEKDLEKVKKPVLSKEELKRKKQLNAIELIQKQPYPPHIIEQLINRYTKAVGLSEPKPKSTISYGGLDLLRKNALTESKKPNAPTGSADVHGLLSGKRHEFMDIHGTPEEAKAARKYRQIYNKYLNDNETNLKKSVDELLNAPTDKVALDKLMKNPKHILTSMAGLNRDDRRQFTHTLLADMGKKGNEFDIITLADNFYAYPKKLRERALMGYNAAERKQIKSTLSFIDRNKKLIDKMKKQDNKFGKFWGVGKLATLGAAVYKAPFMTPISSTLGYLGAKGLAKAWTNPKLLQRMNESVIYRNPHAEKQIPNNVRKSSIIQGIFATSREENKRNFKKQ